MTCQLNSTQRYHKASLSPHEVNKLLRFWLLRGSSVLAGLTLHHADLKSDADKPQAVRGPTCVHHLVEGGSHTAEGAGLRGAGAAGTAVPSVNTACAGHRTGHSLPACGFPSCSTVVEGGSLPNRPPPPPRESPGRKPMGFGFQAG